MLYIFDVDGTLIQSFIRDNPQKHGSELEAEVYDRVELLPNRYEKLEALTRSDAHSSFALATNQGGVAFGYQTEEQVRGKMAKVCSAFEFFFGKPFSVHLCFEHPKATVLQYCKDSIRRKPGPGMIEEAIAAHRVSMAVFVGDMESDEQAARTASVPYMVAEDFFA